MEALLSAAAAGDVPALQQTPAALLHATTEDGWSALIFAAKEGRVEAVRWLVTAAKVDVNPPAEGKHSALRGAAMAAHVDVVRFLLAAGARVDVRSQGDRTALMGAVRAATAAAAAGDAGMRERALATVRALLDAGANPLATNSFQETSLSLAQSHNDAELVNMLITSPPPQPPPPPST